MSDIVELLKLLSDGLQKFMGANRLKRAQVAQSFLNLSKTFNAFPPALETNNFNEMRRLEKKTKGLLDSLRAAGTMLQVLGKEDAERFFQTIERVSNAKSLFAERKEGDLDAIIEAAGYFEGYYETLAAESQPVDSGSRAGRS